MYDTVLDHLVLREVTNRPRGKTISDTIKRLKKKEPFKSAGDLLRRYNRLAARLRAEDRMPTPGAEYVFVVQGTNRESQVSLDELFWVFSYFKSLGGPELQEDLRFKILASELADPETIEARSNALRVKLEAGGIDPEIVRVKSGSTRGQR
jgi:hypothetical protein